MANGCRPEGDGAVLHRERQPADIGRMLTWLGENCETFSLTFPAAQALATADCLVRVQVSFEDRFQAAAFWTRYMAWRVARRCSSSLWGPIVRAVVVRRHVILNW
jgi:hypothetical protein